MATYHTCTNFWGPAGAPGLWLAELLDELDRIRGELLQPVGGWLASVIRDEPDYAAVLELRDVVMRASGRRHARPARPWSPGPGAHCGKDLSSAARSLSHGLRMDLTSSARHRREAGRHGAWLSVTPASPEVRLAVSDLLMHLDEAVVDACQAAHASPGHVCAVRAVLPRATPPAGRPWPPSRGTVSGSWRDGSAPQSYGSVLWKLAGSMKAKGKAPPETSPVTLGTEPEAHADSVAGDNSAIPAGYTYLGQFLAHDLTLSARAPRAGYGSHWLRNHRTPSLDLDSLYGLGPDVAPYFYDHTTPARGAAPRIGAMRRDSAERFLGLPGEPTRRHDDVSRTPDGVALIGDPRNDENFIVSQFHLLLVRLHNAVLEDLPDSMSDGRERFLAAQEIVTRAWRDVVSGDYLRRMTGDLYERLVAGRLGSGEYRTAVRRALARRRFLPSEFVFGAFRVGHAMVRTAYDLNDLIQRVPILDRHGDPAEPNQLLGFRPLPSHWTIDWARFFEVRPEVTPQASRRLRPVFSPALSRLREPVTPTPDGLGPLDMARAKRMKLMSGHRAAACVGVPSHGPDGPLLPYLLAEAEQAAGGKHLGPLGAILVGEVLLAILEADGHFAPATYTAPRRLAGRGGAGSPGMPDLIAYATSDPAARQALGMLVPQAGGRP